VRRALAAQEAQATEARQRAEVAERNNASLQVENDVLSSRLHQANTTYTQQVAALTRQAEDKEAEVRDLQDKIQDMQNEMLAIGNSHEQEGERLRKRLAKVERRYARAQNRLDDLDDQIVRLWFHDIHDIC